jgi:hypothetical protein
MTNAPFMRLCAGLALATLAMLPQSAMARVRALFVGIDTYEYSQDHNQFPDLKGSVNDALGVRDALEATYHWGLDRSPPATCPKVSPPASDTPVVTPLPATTTSITLVQSCATRDAILGALRGLIALSAPRDTVLFYYAGHGASIRDTAFDTKAGGSYDTILAYDSRGPNDDDYRMEIADRQLNVIIENALHVEGANVITIIDACHSGTDDRDPARRGRNAPPGTVHGLPALTERLQANPALTTPGHRAHLGAAADDQIALEQTFGAAPGVEHGLFTKALIDTIPQTRGFALADILIAVQKAMAGAAQTPIGDGLLMTLDGTVTAGFLLGAKVQGTMVTLQDGLLGNVTPGSGFALYPDWSTARLAKIAPLATGHVTQVGNSSATLTLDSPFGSPLPANPVARETDHAFGSTKVGIALALRDPAAIAAATRAIPDSKLAQISATPEMIVAPDPARPGMTLLQTPEKLMVAPLPAPADPGFAGALHDALAPRARIDEMVTLANARGSSELQFCISARFFAHPAGFVCPDIKPGGEGLVQDTLAHLAVVNLAPDPRYVYVFALAEDNSVTLLTPQDAPLANGRPLAIDLVPNFAGTIRFLVLATAQAINAAALEQDGGARDPAACSTTLERLLCEANSGSRDGALARIDDWAGTIRTVTVDPATAGPKATGG